MSPPKKIACPQCQKDLLEFTLNALLSVNRCQECYLMWFDRGQLSSWFQRDELEWIASVQAPNDELRNLLPLIEASNTSDYACPRCDAWPL